MSYYPKSKILENQFTNNGDFQIKSTGETYVGQYCILSNGKFFTGKTLTKNSLEIIKKLKTNKKTFFNTSLNNVFSKLNITNKIENQQKLQPFIIKPTQQDYVKGFVTRYFAQDITNKQITIFEINNQDYTSIINKDGKYFDIYKVINFDWKITGPLKDDLSNPNFPIYGIENTNLRILQLKEKEMPGIIMLFQNKLNEFAKP